LFVGYRLVGGGVIVAARAVAFHSSYLRSRAKNETVEENLANLTVLKMLTFMLIGNAR